MKWCFFSVFYHEHVLIKEANASTRTPWHHDQVFTISISLFIIREALIFSFSRCKIYSVIFCDLLMRAILKVNFFSKSWAALTPNLIKTFISKKLKIYFHWIRVTTRSTEASALSGCRWIRFLLKRRSSSSRGLTSGTSGSIRESLQLSKTIKSSGKKRGDFNYRNLTFWQIIS